MPSRDAEPEFIRYLRDQFRRWGPVEIRRMFGGRGVFRGGTMFALIHDEMLFLRSDDANRAAFAAAGMGPFRYRRRGKLVALAYHQAPPEALEDSDLLGTGPISLSPRRCGGRKRARNSPPQKSWP